MKLIERFKSDPKNVYYLIAALSFVLINVIGLILYKSKNSEKKMESIEVQTISEPSITPTEGPEPTDFPTPTIEPSPTVKPTTKPSSTPTTAPSNTPTPEPTTAPSATPTTAPINTPTPVTVAPTASPSATPTP